MGPPYSLSSFLLKMPEFEFLCVQIGPRMTLQLIKVEEGLGQGNVLYHSFSKYCGSSVLILLVLGSRTKNIDGGIFKNISPMVLYSMT